MSLAALNSHLRCLDPVTGSTFALYLKANFPPSGIKYSTKLFVLDLSPFFLCFALFTVQVQTPITASQWLCTIKGSWAFRSGVRVRFTKKVT